MASGKMKQLSLPAVKSPIARSLQTVAYAACDRNGTPARLQFGMENRRGVSSIRPRP